MQGSSSDGLEISGSNSIKIEICVSFAESLKFQDLVAVRFNFV